MRSSRSNVIGALTAALVLAAMAVPAGPGSHARAQAQTKEKLNRYETRSYIMHTDLDRDAAREAAIRMDAMAREYRKRTRGFGRTVRRKLPFYLFRNMSDYYDAGGPAGTGGVFTGEKLMAYVGSDPSAMAWRLIQHEGFHQFAAAAIHVDIPVWVNEGLAEYFGEAIFTGDTFVIGVVRPQRLLALKAYLLARRLKPFNEMMSMSHQQWKDDLSFANYTQGWSMIHFLAHAQKGKYAKKLSSFINDISRGRPHAKAWTRNFGRNIKGFEEEYRKYWMGLPLNTSADLYAQAVACTMASYFARAVSQRQVFQTADAFFAAAGEGKLKHHKNDWLPPSLLEENLPNAKKLGVWSIVKRPRRQPELVCTLPDGRSLVSTIVIKGGRARKAYAKFVSKPPARRPAAKPK